MEGKFLYDIDYDAGLTLTTYDALINQHFYWAKRFQIAWLIKLYLNGEIGVEKLLETFYIVDKENAAERRLFLLKLVAGEVKDFVPLLESRKFHRVFLSDFYRISTEFDEGGAEEEF